MEILTPEEFRKNSKYRPSRYDPVSYNEDDVDVLMEKYAAYWLKKYADHVGYMEGVDFLNETSDSLNKEEAEYVVKISAVVSLFYDV